MGPEANGHVPERTSTGELDGNVALLTGAGSLLGGAIAGRLADAGARVVLAGRDPDHLREFADPLGDAGVAVTADITVDDDLDRIVATGVERFGGVDIVVNNAGILRDKSLHKMSDEDWDLVYQVHLKGAYKVSRAAFPHMRDQGFGRFVMTTSAAGIYGNFGQANYSACKLALHGLSQTIAIEGRAKGVQSNTIAPIAASRLMGTVMDEQAMALLKPEVVSPLVAWLCHEDCESTGGLFEVGAGWISRVRWERSAGAYFDPVGFRPDDVRAAWETVNDFSNATHPTSTGSTFQAIQQNPHLKK